uniref:Uncharacterized protein n=1 Tax=viral metagenome TaxID=1070528 RepID=A0A6C0HAV0_9ZZZZ
MDLNINTWNITFTQNNIDNYDIHSLVDYYFMPRDDNMTYLLNPDLDKYSIIEKIVYDIAMFHFKRLGIEYNKDHHLIEFWFKYKFASTSHVDTDEYDCEFNSEFRYEDKEPILTSITYFSESNIPTIITDITRNDYVNDNYSEKNKINLSFPKYLKQITFHGGKYYHGTCKIFENETSSERKILSIILWNKKKVKVPYFDNHIFQYTNYTKYKKEMIDVTIDNHSELLNITKMEKLAKFIIDKNENNLFIHKSLFKEYIDRKNGTHGDLFYRFSSILNENNFENYELLELSNKIPLENGMDIIEKNIEEQSVTKIEEEQTVKNIGIDKNNIKKDIFTKQRMIEKSFFDHVTCHWIINTTEKYLMNKKNGYSFSKINIDSLKNIQSFTGFSLENLFKTKIVNFYNLNDEKQKFMIKNIHILKLDKNNTKIKDDLADLNIKIVLNNGLTTINFKDGSNIILNKGDFITYNNSNSIENMIFNELPFYILVADIFS